MDKIKTFVTANKKIIGFVVVAIIALLIWKRSKRKSVPYPKYKK